MLGKRCTGCGNSRCVLEDKTVGLARRTDNGSFVFRHQVLYCFRFRLSMQLRRYWLKELSENAVCIMAA
jgi:hypothetical protein